MKILICSACPDSLTSVAQRLNRIRSEQMRLELSARTEVSLVKPEISSPSEHDHSSSPHPSEFR
jgi:hypothetical protein